MATAIKTKLSSSTDGKGIKLVATSTPGTAIHTATSNSTPGAGGIWDEIWLWAFNSDTTTARNLTVEFGGATAPDWNVTQTLPPLSGLVIIVPGLILQNSTTVKAFASLTNVVTLNGFVNQVTN
jgi:hypothetical protein